jgi:hypothetical protein
MLLPIDNTRASVLPLCEALSTCVIQWDLQVMQYYNHALILENAATVTSMKASVLPITAIFSAASVWIQNGLRQRQQPARYEAMLS